MKQLLINTPVYKLNLDSLTVSTHYIREVSHHDGEWKFQYQLLTPEENEYLRKYGKTRLGWGETDRNIYYLDKTGQGLTLGDNRISYYLSIDDAINAMEQICWAKLEALLKLRLTSQQQKLTKEVENV